jgi:membrane protein implicated in regulation of membrane protease activity
VLLLIAVLLALYVLPEPWGAVAVIVAGVLEIAEVAFWMWFSKRHKTSVGAETLIGRTAVAISSCRPLGQVRIDGEIWAARCDEGAVTGEEVVVERVEQLILVTRRAEPTSARI